MTQTPTLAAAPGAGLMTADPTGRAVRAADRLRAGIVDGTFAVGSRLSEPQLCRELGVSRNTLREAFRVLAEERLVVHELNRGVFVRVPTARDVADLYGVRRLAECAAVASYTGAGAGLEQVEATLTEADRCAAAGDWIGVGTVDLDFHRALTALGNRLVATMTRPVWNEMRLAFHVVARPDPMHRHYLARNHVIRDLLVDRGGRAAARELRCYLDEAERQVLAAFGPPTDT